MGFRLESGAELKCVERSKPDPRHSGISFIECTYTLSIGRDLELWLDPRAAEAILALQAQRPQLIAEVEGRYFWIYESRIYSVAERLGRGAVARLAEGREGPVESVGSRWDRLSPGALAIWPPAGLMPFLTDLGSLLPV